MNLTPIQLEEEDEGLSVGGPLNLSAETEIELQPYQIDIPKLGPGDEVELQDYQIQKPVTGMDLVSQLGQEYGRGFTRKDLIEDDRLYEIVRSDLMARSPEEGGFVRGAIDTVTGLAGGATTSGWSKLSREDQVELWLEHQRSFAAGQSVTTVNEVGLVATADDERKQAFGAGYKLFEGMENIFTGDNVTWGDTFSAIGDYGVAAIWDPTTVLGLGVGRAFSAGGTMGAAQATRVAAKQAAKIATEKAISGGLSRTAVAAAAKTASDEVFQKAIAEVGKRAAKTASLKMGVKDFAAYGAVDLVSAIGTDIAYQNVLIDVDAQEQYQYSQTALSALGVIALPALVQGAKGTKAVIDYGISKVDPKYKSFVDTFQNYNQVVGQTVGLSPRKKTKALVGRVKLAQVAQDLSETFSKFKTHKSAFAPWSEAVAHSLAITDKLDLKMNNKAAQEMFWQTFLFGEPTKKSGLTGVLPLDQDKALGKGYIQAMKDAGLVWVPRSDDDTVTGFVADSLEFLPKGFAKQLQDDYKAATGVTLDFLQSNKAMAAAARARTSRSGFILGQSSQISRMLSKGAKKAMEDLDMVTKQTDKDYGHYVQSIWKRMVTSHFGTTALNVKGWATTYLVSGVPSDIINGALNYSVAGGAKLLGKDATAESFARAGKASILGGLNRGYRLLNPNATAADFDQLMLLIPKAEKELSRELAGDAGVAGSDTAARFGFGESKAAGKIEWTVDKAQTLAGVKLQDEVTKQLSFMVAFDKQLMKVHGKSFNEFTENADNLILMQGADFFESVVSPAVETALRETYSFSFSRRKGNNVTRNVARFIEGFSNHPTFGYLIPFGRFFNNSMAFFGDHSGLNAVGHLIKRSTGKKANWESEDFLELVSKSIVGLSVLGVYSLQGREKLENGLSWNQEVGDGGTIRDVTYEFPESLFHVFGQVIAHKLRDGEVPKELREEVFQLVVGQTFRAGDEAFQELAEIAKGLISMDTDETSKAAQNAIFGGIAKVVSGFTRPLDPVNTAAMMMTEDYETADRRQGVKFWNEATRYIDKIIPEEILYGGEREKRNYPTRSGVEINIGKVVGSRVTPEPTPIESLLNSIGARAWKKIQWDGPPEVKNRMDELVAPFLNTYAQQALAKYPDFFERPLHQRQTIVGNIITRAREQAKKSLELSVGDDAKLALVSEITNLPSQQNVKRVMKKFGIEGSVEDLIEEPGGYEKLKTILYFSKNFDENFFIDQR